MQSDSLEAKQNYLRAQIIDSGIDPQCFMVFMGTCKGEGENINLQVWTFQELKKVVKQFKESLEQELKRQEIHQSKLTGVQAVERNRHSMIVADRVMGSKLPKRDKVFYERDDLWDYETLTKAQCSKAHKFFDFKTYPQIACKGVQIKKVGGFLGFGGSYTIELTLVPNFGSTIIRKSEDVDWLRQALLSQYPAVYIPPLPETPPVDPENKKSISIRGKQIVQFLNSLVQYDHLLNNKYAHIFFKESDSKAFENFKYKNGLVDVGKNIKAYQNLEGYFPIEISQRIQQFIRNSSKFSKQSAGVLKSIDTNLAKLSQSLVSVAQCAGDLNRDFDKLGQKYVTLYEKCSFDRLEYSVNFSKKLASIFANLKAVFTNLQVHSKKESLIFRDFNEDNIKGMIKQLNQFESLQKWHKRELDAYLTLKLSLSKRKQQFFLDLSKKEMDQRQKKGQSKQTTLAQKQQMYTAKFPTDSKLDEERRTWQGYINRMFQKSFVSILHVQEKQLERKLTKAYPILAVMLSQRADLYRGFIKYLQEENGKIPDQKENLVDKK